MVVKGKYFLEVGNIVKNNGEHGYHLGVGKDTLAIVTDSHIMESIGHNCVYITDLKTGKEIEGDWSYQWFELVHPDASGLTRLERIIYGIE